MPIWIWKKTRSSRRVYPPIPGLPTTQFSGVAVQNPNLTATVVTVSLYSAQNVQLGSSAISVPSGYRFIAETSELTNASLQAGNYFVVTSTMPVQSFGFIADESQSTLLPFGALLAQP